MTMTCNEACAVIAEQENGALVVTTMSAMFGYQKASQSPAVMSSVPLMGGASGIGLGLALARPDKQVLVLDGDSSLLMELGSLATVAGQKPENFTHFVFKNNAQFAGIANADVPGGEGVDFAATALASGYAGAHKVETLEQLRDQLPAILAETGPVLVELSIEAPQKFGRSAPQPEIPDMQFQRMGAEARRVAQALAEG